MAAAIGSMRWLDLTVEDAAAKTAWVHLWNHPGMVTTVCHPSAVYELSGVAGAFDVDARLDFDAGKSGAKVLDAKQGLKINADGIILDAG